MARPVIINNQGVLGWLQWEAFEFQPYATNTPTSWTSSPLPAGVALTAGTGKISGAAEKPGVHNIALQAHNADGASDPVLFHFGFEASIADPAANMVDLICDLGTRDVLSGPSPAIAATPDGEGASIIPTGLNVEDARKLAALGFPRFQAKFGDVLLIRVQFRRNGVAANITLTELKLALKELEPEGVLAASTGLHSLGSGVYVVTIDLSTDALKGALSNHEADYGTAFPAVVELTWLATNGLPIGGTPIRGSSKNFRADIVRDITA